MLCIIVVAFIWNASSVLVQFIYKDFHFPRPFFLTWVANSLFMILLPLRATVWVSFDSNGQTTSQQSGCGWL